MFQDTQWGTELLVYLFLGLFIGLAQSAGIGGGAILNISLMLGLGLKAKDSMPITYLLLIGGSLASIYSNYGKKDKLQKRYLIDEGLILVTLPMTVCGSVFGTIINHFVSELLVTVILIGLEVYLLINTYRKYQALNNVRQMTQPLAPAHALELVELPYPQTSLSSPQPPQGLGPPFPNDSVVIFTLVIVIGIVGVLIKGGKTYDSILGLQTCGYGSLLSVLVLILISYGMAKYNTSRVADKEREIQGFEKMLWVGFGTGLVGGSLGIGGAMILVPVWITLGIDKDKAACSSGPLIFSSGFISMVVAALCDRYTSIWPIVFFLVLSFVSSYYVKRGVTWVKETYRMDGIILLLLTIIMVIALVLIIPYQIYKYFLDPVTFMAFGYFC